MRPRGEELERTADAAGWSRARALELVGEFAERHRLGGELADYLRDRAGEEEDLRELGLLDAGGAE